MHLDFSSYEFLTFDIFLEKFENAIVRKLANVNSEFLLEAISGVFEVSFEESYAKMLLRRVLARKLVLEEVAEDSVPEVQDLLAQLENQEDSTSLKLLFVQSAAALFPCSQSEPTQSTASFGYARLLAELSLEKENWDSPTATQDELRNSGIEVE